MWRRAVTTTGLVYFVPIHTRPTVAKEPCPELYRRFREARKILVCFKQTGVGKGLNLEAKASRRHPEEDHEEEAAEARL